MGNLTKLGGVIAAISMTAYLQGCSSGDSFIQELDPGTSGATVSGTAAKGLLTNADCTVEDTNGNVLYTTVGKGTACTGVDGRYSIPLIVNPTTPVIVKITARSGETTMKCDNPTGCPGGVAFGQPVSALGENFTMRAIVPSVAAGSTSLNVSVTPWTEVATERAITQAGGTAAAVTAAVTQTAYQEVANVLNNILSLEGTEDAFDGDFFDIPVPDLTNPSTASVSDTADRKRAALLSIATGALLKKTSDSVTPGAVISNLATAFKDDGKFNVNATASNRAENAADDSVNLASLVSDIASTVSTLATALESNTDGTAALTELLGGTGSDLSTTLAVIEEAAETLAEAKAAVADANKDPTAPPPVVSATLSTLDKAKQTIASFVNLLKASSAEINLDAGANTVLEDVGNVLDATSANYTAGLEQMAYLMEGAASMILDKALGDVTAFQSAGCDVSGDNISCSAQQLASTLDDPWNDLLMATDGTIVYTHTGDKPRTVTATGVTVGGNTLALTMAGAESSTETTAPSYTVSAATVDLGSDEGADDISFGTTTKVSGVISGGAGQSLRIEAPDLTMALKDFTFDANLLITRDITISDTLVTNFRLGGYVEITSGATLPTVAADNKGARVSFTIAFKANTGSLNNTTVIPTAGEAETSTNFLAATGIELTLRYPAEIMVFSADGQEAGSATSAEFSATLKGVRNAVDNGDVEALVLKVVGDDLNASLTGDLTVVNTTPNGVPTTTSTWTLGDTNTVITFVIVDTATTSEVSGSVATKAGVSLGTISSNGSVSLTDPDTNESAALTIPTAVAEIWNSTP